MQPAAPATPEVILDTNVLLDWLFFGDAGVAALAAAVSARRLAWVATTPMVAEFEHVLLRPGLKPRRVPEESAARALAELCRTVAAPAPRHHGLVCADPDDQMFIDLALARPVRWLVSRDRALLKLARPALRHGVTVCTPAAWRDADSA